MEKVIEVSNAAITTVSIEVKVIQINKRQMTLAVFRQLPEEDVIDPFSGGLKGTLWGKVNYHTGCEGERWPHIHVIWQKGNELRHAIAKSWLFVPSDEYPFSGLSREESDNIGYFWRTSYYAIEQLDQLFIAV